MKKTWTASDALIMNCDRSVLLLSIPSSGYLENGEIFIKTVTKMKPLECAINTHNVPKTLNPWMNCNWYSTLGLWVEILNRIFVFLIIEKQLITRTIRIFEVEYISNNVPISNRINDTLIIALKLNEKNFSQEYSVSNFLHNLQSDINFCSITRLFFCLTVIDIKIEMR